MRSILEDVVAFGIQLRRGVKKGFTSLTITGNQTIVEPAPYVLAYDPTNTTRTITLPAVTAADNGLEHEIMNISTGTGSLTVNSAAAALVATVQPGSFVKLRVINGVWTGYTQSAFLTPGTNSKSVLSLYMPYATIANTNIIAQAVPFAFTLTSIAVRPKVPVTTAAKAATLTAGIAASGTGALTNVTGGVVSMTSANQTPTNTPVAGTAITAANTGAAGAAVGATASAVTAFLEGDGYLELGLTRTD